MENTEDARERQHLGNQLKDFKKLEKFNWDIITEQSALNKKRNFSEKIDVDDLISAVYEWLYSKKSSEGFNYFKKTVNPFKSKANELIKLYKKAINFVFVTEIEKLTKGETKSLELDIGGKEKEDGIRIKDIIKNHPEKELDLETKDLLKTVRKGLLNYLIKNESKRDEPIFKYFFERLEFGVKRGKDYKAIFGDIKHELAGGDKVKEKELFYKWENFRKTIVKYFKKEEKNIGIPAKMVVKYLNLTASIADRIVESEHRIIFARWMLGNVREELYSTDYVSPEQMVEDLRAERKKKTACVADRIVISYLKGTL